MLSQVTIPSSLSDDLAAEMAERFRVLADPTRLRLLYLLGERERTVSELARALGCSQANVSKHVSRLAEAGLVRRRRRGLHSGCAVADPAVFALCEAVCDWMRRDVAARARALPPPGGGAQAARLEG